MVLRSRGEGLGWGHDWYSRESRGARVQEPG